MEKIWVNLKTEGEEGKTRVKKKGTWISLFLFSSQVSIASSESVMWPSELQCSLPTW